MARSKYTNLGRLMVGITDLLGVRWLRRRFRGTDGDERNLMGYLAHWYLVAHAASL